MQKSRPFHRVWAVLPVFLAVLLLFSACKEKKQTPTVTRVSLAQSAVTLQAEQTYTMKPSVAPQGIKTTFAFSSSDETVAKVNADGVVTAVARGDCTVTAAAGGKKALLAVTVQGGISPKKIAVSDPSWTNRRVPVLMYHSITTSPGNNLCVPTAKFDAQMQWLSQNGYTALSMEELYDHVSARTALPEKTVVVTLDDGYIDNYVNAFPILKKYGVKATVFMISSFIGKVNYLTADQIREMSANGVAIQDHTVTHPHLSTLSYAQQLEQLRDSKQTLENLTGHTVQYVAYPFGDQNADTRKAAAALGYRLGFLEDGGAASVDGSPLTLTRVYVSAAKDLNGFIKLVQTS